MTLYFKGADEITLPSGIAASGLTLAEIGAVTCLACLQHGAADNAAVFESEEMRAAMKLLLERKLFSVGLEDGVVKITVDLSVVGL